jgi:hypothetical protein
MFNTNIDTYQPLRENVRLRNAILEQADRCGLVTMDDLCSFVERDNYGTIRYFRNIGKKSLCELQDIIYDYKKGNISKVLDIKDVVYNIRREIVRINKLSKASFNPMKQAIYTGEIKGLLNAIKLIKGETI